MLRNDSPYKHKNIFFISDRDYFFQLQADALINKVGIEADSILAVVYKTGQGAVSSEKPRGIRYIKYEDINLKDLLEAKSFTFISLNNWNSPIVEKLIDLNDCIIEKLYIFITDDEVERWRKNREENGVLSVDLNAHISESCIQVLKKVKFFIAPTPYFKPVISRALNRNALEFYNCSIIFDILPHEASGLLKKSLNVSGRNEPSQELRVLIGTKGVNWVFLLKIIWYFTKALRKRELNKVRILVLLEQKNQKIIDRLLFLKRFLGVKVVDFTYLSRMPPHLYNATVASCDVILLQDRGGASTARLFCKWACGTLVIRKKTPNYFFFKDVYNIDFISFERLKEIPSLLKREKIDNEKNAKRILSEEKRSIEIFAKIYN